MLICKVALEVTLVSVREPVQQVLVSVPVFIHALLKEGGTIPSSRWQRNQILPSEGHCLICLFNGGCINAAGKNTLMSKNLDSGP